MWVVTVWWGVGDLGRGLVVGWGERRLGVGQAEGREDDVGVSTGGIRK